MVVTVPCLATPRVEVGPDYQPGVGPAQYSVDGGDGVKGVDANGPRWLAPQRPEATAPAGGAVR